MLDRLFNALGVANGAISPYGIPAPSIGIPRTTLGIFEPSTSSPTEPSRSHRPRVLHTRASEAQQLSLSQDIGLLFVQKKSQWTMQIFAPDGSVIRKSFFPNLPIFGGSREIGIRPLLKSSSKFSRMIVPLKQGDWFLVKTPDGEKLKFKVQYFDPDQAELKILLKIARGEKKIFQLSL